VFPYVLHAHRFEIHRDHRLRMNFDHRATAVRYSEFNSASGFRYPKALALLTALIGSVQGSFLVYALPAIFEDTTRIVFQDLTYFLFVAYIWKLRDVNISNWLRSPIPLSCVLFLSIDIIFQVFHGLANGQLSATAIFRETRLLMYFFITMLCFGSIKCWSARETPALTLQGIFLFAAIGTAVYMILATQVVFSGDDLNYFSSKDEAISSGFGHVLQGKFKSPPIMIAFLSAYLMALLISPTSCKTFVQRALSRLFESLALASVFLLAISSNSRSLLIAYAVGSIIPLAIEVARVIFLRRSRGSLLGRSIFLIALAAFFAFGAITIEGHNDEKFWEQIISKGIYDDSDKARLEAVTRAATFDMENPIGFGVGAGSNFVQLSDFWMNPIDSGPFHAVTVLGYQFLIPYLMLYFIAIFRAFSTTLRRSGTRFDFSLRCGLFAAVSMGLFSFYQTAPFLFPPEALLSGAVLGASISIYRSRSVLSLNGVKNAATD
jgi:hypothetical protein